MTVREGAMARWWAPCAPAGTCQARRCTGVLALDSSAGARKKPRDRGPLPLPQAAREGATLWMVPISISYERVPEQAALAEELDCAGQGVRGGSAGFMGLVG